MVAQASIATFKCGGVSMINDLHVVTEFHRNLGGRYEDDGDWSGEEFREKVLRKALLQSISEGRILRVDFDGTTGMPTSFLEEAFGGLMRGPNAIEPNLVKANLQVVSPKTPRHWPYVDLTLRFIDEEASRPRQRAS